MMSSPFTVRSILILLTMLLVILPSGALAMTEIEGTPAFACSSLAPALSPFGIALLIVSILLSVRIVSRNAQTGKTHGQRFHAPRLT